MPFKKAFCLYFDQSVMETKYIKTETSPQRGFS